MAQELQRPSLAASLGQAIGGGVNKAFLDILNGIAQNKISQLEDRQQPFRAQGESPLRDLRLISEQYQPQQGLSPQALDTIKESQQPSLQDALGILSNQQQPKAPKQSIEQQPRQPRAPQQTEKPKATTFPKDTAKLSDKQIDKILNSAGPKTPKRVQKAEQIVQENPDPVKHAQVVEKQNKKISKIPKLSEKQQLAADKETKAFFDEIHKSAKAAKEGNLRLDRMIELIKDGNLTWPSVASFLDTVEKGIPLWDSNIGLDFHWLENRDSQEFRKLSNDFIKNAKDIFGARVTNQDLISFMKTVPTLSQTDAGKVRVIRNLRLMNEIAIVKKKAMDEIIDENDGERPRNIESLVEKRTQDQVDAISEKFKKGIITQDEASALMTARERWI